MLLIAKFQELNCDLRKGQVKTIIQQEAQLMLTKGLDAFVGQSRSTNILGPFQVK